jgi:hypothetical protein
MNSITSVEERKINNTRERHKMLSLERTEEEAQYEA